MIEPTLIKCAWCDQDFYWTPKTKKDERPTYHPSCRKSAQKNRSKRRKSIEELSTAGVCPRPFKKVFATTDLAWDWIVENHEDDMKISVYRCECGAIHIGHSSTGRKLTPAEESARLAAQGRRGTPEAGLQTGQRH